MMMLAALRCGAQGIIVPRHLLDSVANPPLERNDALHFDREEISGIRLSESDSAAVFTFPFSNVGDKPLVITRVVTSCGCTTARFDKAPIRPGGQGTVRVTYKPARQAGKLLRSIFVYTSASNVHPATRLQLIGEVTPDKYSPEYPVVMGALRVKRTTVRLGTITREETLSERIGCINTGTKPLRLQSMDGLSPDWIDFRTEPETIAPGMTADLIVTVHGERLPALRRGPIEQAVVLEGVDCRPSQRTLRIRLEIK